MLRFAAVKADGLLADLDLPPAAYRALLKLRAHSEAGGRITIDQAAIGELLNLSRPSVNAALRSLELAKLVAKVQVSVLALTANFPILSLTNPNSFMVAPFCGFA